MAVFDEDTRLKLIGLKALATDYNDKLAELADLANRLCREEVGSYGHSSEFIFDNSVTIDQLERRLAEKVA